MNSVRIETLNVNLKSGVRWFKSARSAMSSETNTGGKWVRVVGESKVTGLRD